MPTYKNTRAQSRYFAILPEFLPKSYNFFYNLYYIISNSYIMVLSYT